MQIQYTAAQFRRSEKRLAKNAQVVTDNFGTTYKITASKRILAVHSPMTGRWESPKANDGQVRGVSRYVYLTGNFTKSSAKLYA